jgi:rhodanese-related sulfurtransferase
MAVGLAEREGFTDIGSLAGGLHGWEEQGHAVVLGVGTPAVAPSVTSGKAVLMPEVIEARALATVLMDAPQLYAIVDIRPAWQFAEYHLPGATNVGPDAVANHLRGLPQGTRVVLADRDGTVAYAVAGSVLAELGTSAPTIRVLSGGTAAYWTGVELDNPVGTAPVPALPPASAPSMQAAPVAAPLPAPAAPTAPAPKPATKKRSAGC